MNLAWDRDVFSPEFTLGKLSDEAGFRCYTVEDAVRDGPKIHGETAIPAGRYRVIVTHSPRFKRQLPLLLNVPGFDGIRIHPGNDSGDTEGCLIVGRIRTTDGVGESRLAFNDLFFDIEQAILAAEEVWITVK